MPQEADANRLHHPDSITLWLPLRTEQWEASGGTRGRVLIPCCLFKLYLLSTQHSGLNEIVELTSGIGTVD